MSDLNASRAPRVLLIDDDDVVIGSLRRYLAAQGSHVEIATDPTLTAGEFDVVVVDPYLTGARHDGAPSLIVTARTTQPHASLFVLTAYPSNEINAIAAAQNAVAVLTKPQSIVYIADLVIHSCASTVGSAPPALALSPKGSV
ncbi:MAG TPA: hypothetical protein VHW00_00815 [Thermoanaerobaculia bacterium]|nr:hypothetical protein [Thermoanaerobaculia bacterium]